MVQWLRDNGKFARANTASHCAMSIRAEMRIKVVPNEYSVKVCVWDIACLNITANKITKIMENVGCVANGAQTSDPSIWRKNWVPWLDCKDYSDL
jgi:hypothetical protein